MQLPLLQQDPTRASRSDAIYGTHAYHTKVPPAVAAMYIERHCPVGGTVLDPFCGSGMTGVGAALAGRQARLSDLSPAAVHIARNYCTPCDPAAFRDAVERVLAQVGTEVEAMYLTDHEGQKATVEHVVWSDVRRCPKCGAETCLWDVRDKGLRALTCETCGHEAQKAQFAWVGESAVQTSLATGGRSRTVRPALEADLRPGITTTRWAPRGVFNADRPMWRKQHADMGIETVADFFSPRNLAALAALWAAASEEPDARLRSALRFSITAIVNRASRRYQWNAKRPTNVLSGTLYISSLRYEWNVMSLWRRKVSAVTKMFTALPLTEGAVQVRQQSATALDLPDESIDYCFCDPPFGAHIVYSDASLLWESWLDDLTDRSQEAIVVSTGDQAKTVDQYGSLMERSFREIARVLKPEARATVVFQATDLDVWKAVTDAAQAAGLHLATVSTLDKGQPSFKQIKGRVEGERVAQSDVVMTFEKCDQVGAPSAIDPREIVNREIEAARAAGEGVSVGHVFTEVAAEQLRSGAEPLAFDDVADLVDCRVREIEMEASLVVL